MADGGHRRIVFEVRIGKDRAIVEQPLDPAGVLRAESRQVVVAELIDRDEQHQPNVGTDGRLSRGKRHHDREHRQQDGANPFHMNLNDTPG
jgi:hypothetical protein